jgi:hypothetical protein
MKQPPRFPASRGPLPPEGAEPGHERSGGPVVPGEGLGRKPQRGLQGGQCLRAAGRH